MTITIRPGTRLNPGMSVKVPVLPDGLTANRASTSAWQIKQDYPDSANGLYWIKNANINSGAPFQIYADMGTNGGGWTLLVQSTGYTLDPVNQWTNETVLERNASTPPATLENYGTLAGGMDPTKNYSILGWADYIKKTASGGQATFDYMLDAGYRTCNGGIWTANENYSFVATYGSSPFGTALLDGSGFRKNITEIAKFNAGAPGDPATWDYAGNTIEARMPYVGQTGPSGYLPGGNAMLTTDSDGTWWGTIISLGSFTPAPWLETWAGESSMANNNPRVIWYWVR